MNHDQPRCAGRLDFGHGPESICPHRGACDRYLQIERDRLAGLPDYRGMTVMMHCVIDGEYTMRMDVNDTTRGDK